jgi:peptidoglycan lytic transglycosylase
MKSNLHTTEKGLLNLLSEADGACLKRHRVPVEMTSGLLVYGPDDHIGHVRLGRGQRRKHRTLLSLFLFLLISCWMSTAFPAQDPESAHSTQPGAKTKQTSTKATHHTGLDRSGKTRKGKASYYGQKFYSKKMADGTPMNPQSNVAASKTLPLGTKAQVTNLENGKTDEVEIRDRGPYVKNRIVDVSPKTADKLGLKENGTAAVEVKPIEVPQPDGSVKPGTGATDTQPSH